MQDIGGVEGVNPVNSDKQQRYTEDYDKSLDLFKSALTEYSKPDVEVHKKAKLEEVMDEALHVMNESAAAALNKGKQEKEQALEKTYSAYIEDPSAENKQKVIDDIKSLEKS